MKNKVQTLALCTTILLVGSRLLAQDLSDYMDPDYEAPDGDTLVNCNDGVTYYNLGMAIAQDMKDNQPKDTAYDVCLAFASDPKSPISYAAYKYYDDNNSLFFADNDSSTIAPNTYNATIQTDGSFTISGGVGGPSPITGSISQSQGQSVTVNSTLSFTWTTVIPKNKDGSVDYNSPLIITYTYSFNGTKRPGIFTAPAFLTLNWINSIHKNFIDPKVDGNDSGGNGGGGSSGVNFSDINGLSSVTVHSFDSSDNSAQLWLVIHWNNGATTEVKTDGSSVSIGDVNDANINKVIKKAKGKE